MNLEQRILFIKQNLLDKGGYSIAAKECLGIIEFALRELLLRHITILDIETQQSIAEKEKKEAKNGRGKSIQDFTMGQLLGIIRETDFVNAWAKATHKDLINIRMINLDALSKLRNDLIHKGEEADASQAHFLFYSLQLIIESFGIESLEQTSLTDFSNLPPLVDLINPYRGLAAFREQDSEYFFGRSDEIDDLQQLISERNFVAVIGNSGSGKSSLVFAGLLPKVRQMQGWLMAVCRPKAAPFYQIAETLVDTLYQTEPNEIVRLNETKTLTDHFKNQTLEIDQIVQRILQKHNSEHILLVIDQFEELYTLNPPAIQQQFIDFLLTKPSNLTLLITLRADFLGYALSHEHFAKCFDAYRNKMLGNLGIQNLQQAIEEPALKLSIQFEEGLIERIIQDVGIQTGSLPLLQFTLQQLWEKREQNKLTHTAYEALGTVTQALTNYADEVYKRLSEEGQQQLRYLFVQMVRPGEGTEDTRQVAFLKHLNAAQREIIKQLADARLVVTSRIEQTGEETVEVAHEALIRHWQPLREWMTEDRSFRVWQERIRSDLKEYQLKQQDKDLLLRGARLIEAEENLDKWRDHLVENEIDFIQISLARRQQERAEKLAQQRRLKLLTSVALIIAIVAGFFYFKAEEQKDIAQQQTSIAKQSEEKATQEKQNAIEQRNEALKTQSLFLADLSRQEFEKNNVTLATLLALEGLPIQWNEKGNALDRPFVSQAVDSLYASMISYFKENLVLQFKDVIFNPHDQQIIASSNDRTVKLWNIQTGNLLQIFKHEEEIKKTIFSPNGQQIFTISGHKTAKLWDVKTGNLLQTFKNSEKITNTTFFNSNGMIMNASFNPLSEGMMIKTGPAFLPSDRIKNASFSPNGEQIVIISDQVKLWNAQTGSLLHTFKYDRDVENAIFSPNGEQVLTISGNEIKLWNIQGDFLKTFKHDDRIENAIFSPNGKQILTASWDKKVKLWDVQTGDLLQIFNYINNNHSILRDNTMIFSPNGEKIIIALSDKTAKLWDVQTGYLLQEFKHDDMVINAEFSPNGQQTIITYHDGIATLWDVQTGNLLQTFKHNDSIRNSYFSSNGQQIITVSQKMVKLWDVQINNPLQIIEHDSFAENANFSSNGEQIITISNKIVELWDIQTENLLQIFKHNESVRNASFSPDNQKILTASRDGKAKLWDVQTGRLLQTFKHDFTSSASFSPSGQQIVTVSRNTTNRIVKLWDVQTGNLLHTFKHDAWTASANFSPNGQLIITASGDKTVKLWDVQTGNLLQTFKHNEFVRNASFSSNGQQIITASGDKTAKLWDVQTGNLLQTFKHDDWVINASFSSNGQQIITASGDKTAKLWDVKTGNLLQTFKHDTGVNSATFSPNDQRIITSSEDNKAKLWNAQTGNLLQTFKHDEEVRDASFNPNGQQILTVSNNIAKLWKIFPSTQELINYAKEQLPLVIDGESPPRRRTLTCEERQRFFLSLPKECTALSQSIEKE